MYVSLAIYQKLRDQYEGSSAHGDPYYINHYLMAIKYEEGSDLMGFFLELERALKDAADATGIVMTDEQKSLYLYHAMPSTWTPDLAIWKGSKKFIPYTDLKTNIERKVLDDYAKRKYIIDKDSPESRGTSNETALKAGHNAPDGRDELAPPANVYTYCQRPYHAIRDCRVLQKHLRTGTVKDGTVLPASFAIIERMAREDMPPFPAKHPRYQRSDDRQRPSGRPDQGSQPCKVPEIYDCFGNPVNYQDLQRKYHSRGREAGLIAYATILMSDIGLSATPSGPHDPTWAADSGCNRHAAYQESWFKEIWPYAGAIMVGGKQQLPIRGIGDIILEVADSEGTTRQLEFCDVLFVADMKFNLLSIAQVLKVGIRLVFSRTRCTFFVGNDYKLHVELAADMDLFQLKAKTPPKTSPSALMTWASADDKPANAQVTQPGVDPNVLLWHKRLGHPNFRVMQTRSKTQAVPELAFSRASAIPKHFSPSCIFAKAHRAPFNCNVDRSKAPFDKVHSDINGPLAYPSLSGAHYFITFIDDFSRFMHLYVVACKSDLYDCYEKFRKAAKTDLTLKLEH